MNQILAEKICMDIENMTDDFYQNRIKDGCNKLTLILHDIMVLTDEVQGEEQRQNIMEPLQRALEAMENQDYILLADIMQYDLAEALRG